MATPLAYTARYTHPAAAVRAAVADEQYWKDRIAAVGGPNARLESVSVEGDQVRVEMVQAIAAELLPSAITAVRPGDLVIPRTENWTGTAATFEARVEGAPAEVRGTITLSDIDAGSTAVIEGSIEVKVPLFGGKIEAAIAERLTELLAEETEFTNAWISER
ncbi:DUF2505 domain-containing protein [Nocardia cyriacigeorgica]|uniref:DUF2505 domain-containing protein n=2 Tax=Nocardia cyriacigeorgica TaxID=135487 RepID=H6R440_NOCCG|nr:DUF2505 domain-containing protein [Nocardia cyriacigeorgica]MBF6082221.1 DUF2505 domain-containing protein [Nocardia cyriacigeorgica]MBF6285191.1 DUF2505 domain-containing protein [Nocardia cyriacigeorgica]MBF6426354.1 DUF2505 domain-containing protein [Nocardia cyriacigeorgica]NEW35889.1 DUF2505 domain-containing protein [Nocardia cyriacigeorgica]CCF65754.1 conserved protein of unknown function [Nocardia cyriacigeorgica GUH-2]